MTPNLYWPIYKNIENEFLSIARTIHIDDKQLHVYSSKIGELLLRTVVEIESLSKKLFFENGGEKSADYEQLMFDKDCLRYLDYKWTLNKKKVIVSSHILYLEENTNRILRPFKKATSGRLNSDPWFSAFQSIKHDRVNNLEKSNIKNLIRALSGLFLLNVYNLDYKQNLGKDSTPQNIDTSFGSDLFSLLVCSSTTVNLNGSFKREDNFDESTILIHATDESYNQVIKLLKQFNLKMSEYVMATVKKQAEESILYKDIKDIEKQINDAKSKAGIDFLELNHKELAKTLELISYQAVINKNQI